MPQFNLDTAHIIELYQSGHSLNQIAQAMGCSFKPIRARLVKAGIKIRPKPNPDPAVVASLYLGGMSENQVAQHLGVARGCVRNRLIKAGITPRNQSQSESLKWSQFTAEQRLHQVASANEACRGRVHTEEERIKRAQTRYLRQTHISPNEQRLADMLRARGLTVKQQVAVHTCNVDLSIEPGPIAVEVHGGGWHSTPFHRRLMSSKREQLFSRGWALVEVWIDRRFNPWEAVTDQLVTLCETLCLLPSCEGEHWVVLGNRKTPALFRADSDDVPAVFRPDGCGSGASDDTGVS